MSQTPTPPHVLPNKQTVVILDTGLQSKPAGLLYAYDFYDLDSNIETSSTHGSVVYQQAMNADPNANLIMLKVGASDETTGINTVAVSNALKWVSDYADWLNVASVNLSFGTSHTVSSPTFTSLSYRFDALKSAGVAVVVAAGNDGSKSGVSDYAASDDVICVSASDGYQNFASFSNRDADLTDIASNGSNISYNGARYSGTSLSAPTVSGAIAKIQDTFFSTYARELSVDELVTLMQKSGGAMNTAGEIAGTSNHAGQGYAQLDLKQALSFVSNPTKLNAIGIGTPAHLLTTTASDSLASKAYSLYFAAFDRAPDTAGLGYWISKLGAGMSLHDVSANFVYSAEFKTRYGQDISDETFVNLLYTNVLYRAPDQGGFEYWTDILDTHRMDRAGVLEYFSQSPENLGNIAPVIAEGIKYETWLG